MEKEIIGLKSKYTIIKCKPVTIQGVCVQLRIILFLITVYWAFKSQFLLLCTHACTKGNLKVSRAREKRLQDCLAYVTEYASRKQQELKEEMQNEESAQETGMHTCTHKTHIPFIYVS